MSKEAPSKPEDDLEFIALRLLGEWNEADLAALLDDLATSQAAAKECGLGIRIELIRKPKTAPIQRVSPLIMPPALKPRASVGGLLLAGPNGQVREVDK